MSARDDLAAIVQAQTYLFVPRSDSVRDNWVADHGAKVLALIDHLNGGSMADGCGCGVCTLLRPLVEPV